MDFVVLAPVAGVVGAAKEVTGCAAAGVAADAVAGAAVVAGNKK